MTLPHPPANGGFVVVRAIIVLVALLLPAVLLVAPAGRHQAALAQTAPQAQADNPDSMVQQVVTLDSEINGLTSRLGQLEAKSESLMAKISNTNDQIAAKRKRLADKRRALGQRARNIYVNGKSNTITMLLKSNGVSDFIQRTEYLHKVNQRDTELISTVRRDAALLEASVSDLKQSRKQVDSLAAELRSRKDRLVKSKAEKQQVLARAGAQATAVQSQSGKVESKMSQVNATTTVTGKHTGRYMMMVATGYSPQEPGLTDSTASGLKAQHGVVAVDPSVIPLGTRLYVEGYGSAIAGDTGSAIKGNRIDLCFDTLAECNAYGNHTVRVEILD